MASIKNLKKDINHTLGDIIEECYVWELLNPKSTTDNSQAIIDEAVGAYDTLLDRVNAKNIENKSAHFKTISADLESTATALIERVNKL